jgi:rubredoxin
VKAHVIGITSQHQAFGQKKKSTEQFPVYNLKNEKCVILKCIVCNIIYRNMNGEPAKCIVCNTIYRNMNGESAMEAASIQHGKLSPC